MPWPSWPTDSPASRRGTTHAKGEGRYPARTSHYATTCGQGLAAWLCVHHADDGPLEIVSAEEAEEWDDEIPPCNKHCIRIDWDTGYAYRGRNGEGCGDLHARMVAAVGRWLDEQGLTWWWHDECRGEWHRGHEGLDRLGDIGEEARSWFLNSVAPAIAAQIRTDRA